MELYTVWRNVSALLMRRYFNLINNYVYNPLINYIIFPTDCCENNGGGRLATLACAASSDEERRRMTD